MALPKEEIKTIADIEALPEGTRAELIDGRLFLDTAPTVTHQAIVNFLVTEINIYIRSKGGKCRVFPSPFDVQLYRCTGLGNRGGVSIHKSAGLYY